MYYDDAYLVVIPTGSGASISFDVTADYTYSSYSTGIGGGVIAGIVIGSIAFIALFVGLSILSAYMKNRNRQNFMANNVNNNYNAGATYQAQAAATNTTVIYPQPSAPVMYPTIEPRFIPPQEPSYFSPGYPGMPASLNPAYNPGQAQPQMMVNPQPTSNNYAQPDVGDMDDVPDGEMIADQTADRMAEPVTEAKEAPKIAPGTYYV